ncbi:MAG: methyltransferase domain-containing protein [Candidatus Bathyarchaeota archaeon]|nr:methyltransferase domain-containing protein [Candidatus Bathyarchaeota archaeon]
MPGERNTEDNLGNPYRWDDHPESLAPYVPSPVNIVREMLQLAGVGSNDIVYDLGCGDGRILFVSVEEFKAQKAVGYELNQEMVDGLEKTIREKSLSGRIFVHRQNFMDVDLSEATLVTMYLTTSGNAKLKPKLEKELKSGSRAVSHDFPVHGWATINPDGMPFTLGNHKIYIYCIPDCYKKEPEKMKISEEENRWWKVKKLFTQIEKE